jgi:hypothetical protein
VGRTPWTRDQPIVRLLPTHTHTHTQRINVHSQPCLEWDSNPPSQRSSERRHFTPETARPLRSVIIPLTLPYSLLKARSEVIKYNSRTFDTPQVMGNNFRRNLPTCVLPRLLNTCTMGTSRHVCSSIQSNRLGKGKVKLSLCLTN